MVPLLLKIGQCGIAAQCVFLFLVWKQIVDSAQKMKRVAGQSTELYIATGVSIFMFVVTVPLSMIEATQALGGWSALMGNISNIFFLLLFLGLFGGGAYYAIQLNTVIVS